MNIKNKTGWFILAGFCGGMAEVIWIGFYSLFNDPELSNIASAISQTISLNNLNSQIAPLIGLIIHLCLSVLLAIAFGFTVLPFIQRLSNNFSTLIASLITLTIVWKINFFILLPVWNPDFINLLPLHVTLLSKLLFGLSMGIILVQQKLILR